MEAGACHVVALPYPGRGHINPMMNLCKVLVLKKPDILVTFVVTEEWLGLIRHEPIPHNIVYATIPNVVPSELVRGKNFPGFFQAVCTELEAPFEQLLGRLELEKPVRGIIADTYVMCAVKVGNRRNIPVASLWTMSASVFSLSHNFELLRKNGHFPAELSERGDEEVDYIPGCSKTRLVDLPTVYHGDGRKVLHLVLECISWASNVQYLLLTSFYELEPSAVEELKAQLAIPVYPVGPTIPYFVMEHDHIHNATGTGNGDYMEWLNSQPKGSVMYVSLGSFLSVSSEQLDEIVAGVRESGVPFLWVLRGGALSSTKGAFGDKGMVVPWCEQLKVLCHPSVGGFWTHCGWNSTLEAVYAGVPILTCPIFFDQVPNSKMITDDWKVGLRGVRGHSGLVKRDEIAGLVMKLMDHESGEGKEMKKRIMELRESCQSAVAKGGSSDMNMDSFISEISGE